MKRVKFALLLSDDEEHLIDISKDFSTKDGTVKAGHIKLGGVVKTHLGKKFVVVEPSIKDIIENKLRRTAQVILPKDIALILAYTGISSDSLVVDAGTGSGYTSIFIANYIPNGKVVTYENDKRFLPIARDNIKICGLKNIELRFGDVTKRIKEKNVDMVVLDLKDAFTVVKHAHKSLRLGGYLVIYSPTVEHLMKSLSAIRKKSFIDIKTVENIVREWQTERTTRPKTVGLMHTGFLTFARKV